MRHLSGGTDTYQHAVGGGDAAEIGTGYSGNLSELNLTDVTIQASADVYVTVDNNAITTNPKTEESTFSIDYMFIGCEKLTTVSMPTGLTALSDGMFENCEELRSVINLGSHNCEL